MDTNLIAAMSGVLGSLVGGSATVATAWITQKTLTGVSSMSGDMRQREKVYRRLLVPRCAKLLIDASPTRSTIRRSCSPLRLTNRIRLTASQPVLAEAEHLLSHITDQYFSRNLTVQELRQRTRTRGDPLKAFSEACRTDSSRYAPRM